MGKQFYIRQNEFDIVEFVQYLFKNEYRICVGIPHKTNKKLDKNFLAHESDNYSWDYLEIKGIDQFMKFFKKGYKRGEPLSIYKGDLNSLLPYDKNFFLHKDYSFYPMIEYSPDYRLWISSEAKGMLIWQDFDAIKKYFSSNYVRQKINGDIIYSKQ